MERIVLAIAAFFTILLPVTTNAESLDYVIADKIIHVTLIGEISVNEAYLFDDEMVAIAKHLPKESDIIIDRGDGFWTFIGISKNGKVLGAGISDMGNLNSETQFKTALKMLIEQIIDHSHASKIKTGAKRLGFLFVNF